MDFRNVLTPPTADARYERLSGGPTNRAIVYVARRYLKLSAEEWSALPWWVQRTYLDGLQHEGVLVAADSPEAEVMAGSKDLFEDVDIVMASDGDLRRMGLTVIDGG